MLGLAGAVHDAAHDRDPERLGALIALAPAGHLGLEVPLDLLRHLLEEGRRRAPAAGAGGDLRREDAEPERLEDLLGDLDLLGPVAAGPRREGHADRVADPFLEEDGQPGRARHDALHSHARLGEAEVERVVGAGRQAPVDVDQVLHARDLRRQDDPVVAEPGRLGQLGRADRALHDRVQHHVARVARLRELRVGVHHLGQEVLVQAAPVDADADRLAVVDGDPDDRREVLVAVLGADVAGVDPVLGERPGAGRVLREEEVAVVVEVADDRHVHLADDVGHRPRRLVVVDRDPDELAARLGERAHLGDRPRDVRRVGVGHRLDDDRVRAADLDAAHVHGRGAPALDSRHVLSHDGSTLPWRPRRPFGGRPVRSPAPSTRADGRTPPPPRRSSCGGAEAGGAC